jgi:glycogen operon protein
VQLGLVNYWGYNTLGFFCPGPRYATQPTRACARDEFRTMVKAAACRRHRGAAGRGLQPHRRRRRTRPQHQLARAGQRQLVPPAARPPRRLRQLSGCGNTFDMRHPRGLQMVLDSLRYWVQEMHVDGFRFDLAPVLGRGHGAFERHGAFFKTLQQDPVLAG